MRPIFVTVAIAFSLMLPASPQQQTPAFAAKPQVIQQQWGDQGDGTYVNPVLPADFSDVDAIRAGKTYYMISSTMQYDPGMVVLASSDLVNWRIVGHVVVNIADLDAALGPKVMNRPGRGIWAGAIRFHAGLFRVYFGTPDGGIYTSSAAAPAGPWSTPHLVLAGAGWDDPCPFWGDDGVGYLITTRFLPDKVTHVPYNIHLFRLSTDGLSLVPGYDRILHHSQGSEANKLYKFHGLYYHFYSEVRTEGRVPMMERSRSLNGPWVTRQLMHVHGALDKEPNQGGFLETPAGKWYFLTHQGRGDWEGRAAVLLPVQWLNGWPIPGSVGSDGIGNMEWSAAKPVNGYPRLSPAFSDDFNAPALQSQWEWQYQPLARGWSLTEHPGFLRLYAFASLRAPDLRSAPDILTQRSMRTSHSRFTIKLDLKGLAEGQRAGLIHFAATYAALTVTQVGTSRRIGMDRNGVYLAGPAIRNDTIWLRSDWDFNGTAHFSYSLDGHSYKTLGDAYPLTWGDYRGDRIGIVTENRHNAGYVDVDRIVYEVAR